MSAIFKGYQGVTLVSDEPYFDAESGTEFRDQTFAGSKTAIFGLATSLRAIDRSYRVSNSGPVYTLTVRLNFSNPIVENLDRYEISTESVEKSIFEHPLVVAEAAEYDGLLSTGQRTFREFAEDSVKENLVGDQPTGTWSIQETVIDHLRNGVTGYQFDALLLRRYRRIDLTFAYAGGQMGLDESQLIYSTAQLNLPTNVGFTVPSTPASFGSYAWGWKVRGQRLEIIGAEAEQQFELLFAPWSTLLYELAAGDLDW